MNPEPDNQVSLPLDELNIAPAWVKAPAKSFERHPGDSGERRSNRGDRPFGDRPSGPPRGRQQGPPRDRQQGPPRRDDRRPGPNRGPGGPRRDQGDRPPQQQRSVSHAPAAPAMPLDAEVSFIPNEKVLEGMMETMKNSARAYALFDLAKLVLNKPERHTVRIARKNAPLWRTLLADGVFLSQEDAIRFSLRRCTEKIYSQTEKVIDPPKGNFQFVNRCGLTGEILGPPNFHEYQARIVKHHQHHFPHMPFDRFKASIETSRDPEIVKAWVDSRSKVMEWTCLLDAEPKVFTNRADLEKHVRENHPGALVASAPQVEVSGPASRLIEDPRLLETVRHAWESERKFPIKTVNEIRPHVLKGGFHFFKHKKGITYVSRTKPNRFESIAHLTEHVQKIIVFLRAHEGATRHQLAEHLGPVDETLLATDLHWLIQDGYVVEFFDGKLWALDDKPAKPAAPAATAQPAATVVEGSAAPVVEPAEPVAEVTPIVPPSPDVVSPPTEQPVS